MRILQTSILFFTGIEAALAHTLPEDHSLADQLTHQVIGAHHIPLLVLIVTAGFVLYRRLRSGNDDAR